MKALAVDVERNLRAPLAGLRQTAGRLGLPVPDITVGVRSGDTPADERRRLVTRPPDVLITTPESLFLMLTSQARETLRGVDTVIIDEVHAVAGTKRGAHLAVSLERLDELLERPAQRIGLSATVRPIDEVARFLGGVRPGHRRGAAVAQAVAARGRRTRRGHVRHRRQRQAGPSPARLERAGDDVRTTSAATSSTTIASPTAERERASIWPHVEEQIVDLVEQHRSTIVFANSRRLAERLTARLNEITAERRGEAAVRRAAPARGDHGAERRRQGRPRAARQGAPRLRQQGAAGRHRGRAQGGSAPVRRRHLESRARHRHGCRRPGDPGRVTAVGGQWPAAGRPSRAPGRRGLARRAVPQAPRRPGADRRHRRADAGRPDRGAQGADATRSTCSRSRSSPVSRSTSGRPTRSSRWYDVPHRSRPCRGQRLRRDPRPAGRALPVRRVRRAAATAGLGPGGRHADRSTGRPAAGRHLRRHDPRPRALRGVPRRAARPPGGRRGSASSTRRWSTSRGSATCSRSARRAGGSRRSPTTASWSPPPPGSPAGCRSGRATRSGGRPSSGPRSVPSSGRSPRCPEPQALERAASAGLDAFAASNLVAYLVEQLADTGAVPTRPAARRRALPRRARRLAADHPLAVRRCRPRAVGAGDRRAASGALRGRRAGDGRRRRHRAADSRDRRRATRRRRLLLRARRARRDRHVGGRRVGAVRLPLPRVRGSGTAAATPRPRPALGAVAAAPEVRRAARASPASTARSRSSSRRCASACRTSTTCPRCSS